MTLIKLSKQGKYYISKNNIRVTDDYSFIEKISNKYYALKIYEDGKINWDFFNIELNKIDESIKNGRLIANGFENDHFILDRDTYFGVYDKLTLKEIVSVQKNKDLYNYHYIGEGYSIYEDNLYKQDAILGSLDDFPIFYTNDSTKYCIRLINDFSLFYINKTNIGLDSRCFTIFHKSLPPKIDGLYIVNKNYSNRCVFFFKDGNNFSVIFNDNKIYDGFIDFDENIDTFNIANKNMIDFSNGDKHYVLTNNNVLNGPFPINNFEFDVIYKSSEYSLFYKQNYLIKYNYSDHKITIENSPYDFKIHRNIKTDVLFQYGKEYAKLSVGEDEYFYSEKTKNFIKLEKAINIIPYTYGNEIYYLDENLTEKFIKPEIDVRDLVISDYTYYKNKLYVILRDEEIAEPNGKYIVYDVSNNCIIKIFDSYYEFTDHQGFFLNDIKYHSSSFIYTLDDNGKKIIKLPFKTRSIRVGEGELKFKGMFDQYVSLPLEEPIYIKEK